MSADPEKQGVCFLMFKTFFLIFFLGGSHKRAAAEPGRDDSLIIKQDATFFCWGHPCEEPKVQWSWIVCVRALDGYHNRMIWPDGTPLVTHGYWVQEPYCHGMIFVLQNPAEYDQLLRKCVETGYHYVQPGAETYDQRNIFWINGQYMPGIFKCDQWQAVKPTRYCGREEELNWVWVMCTNDNRYEQLFTPDQLPQTIYGYWKTDPDCHRLVFQVLNPRDYDFFLKGCEHNGFQYVQPGAYPFDPKAVFVVNGRLAPGMFKCNQGPNPQTSTSTCVENTSTMKITPRTTSITTTPEETTAIFERTTAIREETTANEEAFEDTSNMFENTIAMLGNTTTVLKNTTNMLWNKTTTLPKIRATNETTTELSTTREGPEKTTTEPLGSIEDWIQDRSPKETHRNIKYNEKHP